MYRLFRVIFVVCLLGLGGCAAFFEVAPTPVLVDIAIKQQNLVMGAPHRDVLQSGGVGPDVMLMPAGQFLMGSPEEEVGRYVNEGPQHEVIFARPFLMGKTEVTVAQFRRFVKATGYKTDGERNSGSFIRDASAERGRWRLKKEVYWELDHEGKPSRDENPVVHVSWTDAQAYLAWLSKETGKHYRLPSEAEMEYANRAGSTGLYWWGDATPPDKLVNIRGDGDELVADPLTWEPTPQEVGYISADGGRPEIFEKYGDGFHGLAPVGNFSPNPFGLHDTAGNVWEWTQDCWHPNYENAPSDGSAWVEEEICNVKIVKGGSFYCFTRHVRSANRWGRWSEFRNMYIGFRVARDL